ncbi:MAG TPA: acetate kinase, partial [Clostridia bacterium]|nr:acetate kinase [Clostridia bacterium]
IQLVLDTLVDKTHGVIEEMSEINAVGHRVLHGGEKFAGSFIIDDTVMETIKDYIELGPLHNPANIMGIEACMHVMPGVPMVAVFDTSFHQTMPKKAFMYALPYEDYTELKIRRYGFHGTSHKYISIRTPQFLGRPAKGLRIISCHLGNGSSIAAIVDGKCVDTSMGFTPLVGVPMGTRTGDIDPAVIEFLCNKRGMTLSQVMNYMNKKSGVLGISGVSSDFRDILEASKNGNERASLALEVFTYGVKKYIGAYSAAMGGLDAVVFTAGVGENNPVIRQSCLEGLEFLGIRLDNAANNATIGCEADISAADSKVKVLVIPTNEEIVIARDTLELVKNI